MCPTDISMISQFKSWTFLNTCQLNVIFFDVVIVLSCLLVEQFEINKTLRL